MTKRHNWFVELIWSKTATEFHICRTDLGDSPQNIKLEYYVGWATNGLRTGFSSQPRHGRCYKSRAAAQRAMQRLARAELL